MPRSVPEWIGKTDDAKIPPRVQLRIFERYGGRCQKCARLLRPGHYSFDHRDALVNGGRHAEGNLQPLCDEPCHAEKTKADVALKSRSYRSRKRHYGMRKAKGRPIPGTKASGWKHRMDGTWERRR